MSNATILGMTAHSEPFVLKDKDQGQHVFIDGATGTGKSVLMSNMAASVLQTDAGLCLIDPHGTLAADVLKIIPPHRHRQVVFLNMADLERPIGLSFMSDIPEEKRFKAAEDIVAYFVHIWGKESVGDRSQMVLRNALRLAMDDGGTLLAIPKLLKNRRYRTKLLKTLRDDFVRFNWEEIFNDYTKGKEEDVISPILNKLDAILVPPLRNILGQPQATIDVRKMMDEGRILIVSLQKGMIGEMPARFLGSLLVGHIATAAFSRADLLERGDRPRPFYLFADEFTNFVSRDFDLILSETRKYGVFFRLASQYLEQIDRGLQQGILTNCDTKFVFRCSPEDARVLAPVLGLHEPIGVDDSPAATFCDKGLHTPRILTETASRQAWVRTIEDGQVRRPLRIATTPPPKAVNDRVPAMVADSRVRFGRNRADVEIRISQFLRAYPKPKRRLKLDAPWEP